MQNFEKLAFQAFISDAISYFYANVSKNLIESDVTIKGDGYSYSALSRYGFSCPCSFSELIKTLCDKKISIEQKENIDFYTNIQRKLLENFKRGIFSQEVNFWTFNELNKKIYINTTFILFKDENDDILTLVIMKDCTSKQLELESTKKRETEKLAFIDQVTNDHNYHYFQKELNERQTCGYIISVDISSFNIINSVCGISKGDEVIRAVWNCIRATINKEDLAAHINANHYILFVQTDDKEAVKSLMKNITLATSLMAGELDVPQFAPFFGVSYWQPSLKIEQVFNEAVVAKQNVHNLQNENYAFFSPQDTAKLIAEKMMEDNFETAIAKKDFKIYFQPKYNPQTKKLIGAEALVRWVRDGKIVPPNEFIPLFERNGMIRVLDEYVFRNVCQQQKHWLEAKKHIVPISINLSRASLYFKNLVKTYKWIINEIGIETGLVPIEITESAAINNDEIKSITDSFFNAGFSLHMDDFGSGYSSLSALNSLHFETLKLDKSLIDYIGNYGGDKVIEHIVTLAHELGMTVTAEGVENQNQVDFLKNLQCENIQGYFFSKPLPIDDFEKKLFEETEKQTEHTESELNEIAIRTAESYVENFIEKEKKLPIYNFVVNITKNATINTHQNGSWLSETGCIKKSYFDECRYLAENFILPEYKYAYLSFVDPFFLMKTFIGNTSTRTLEYLRNYHGVPTKMKMTMDLFKIKETTDLYMNLSVSKIED
ncbi:GGDEF domain-containing phosphodiesterase [Treponema zioleckii]|uniref:GGDEF domain-containing phosphodiesterase n=1 Tax=Treponema zioleckii TaxID=331680 RepID=UPI00168A8A49|nr:GGDEF domain-containing phosphodiesterase [Treponema zioleckii]